MSTILQRAAIERAHLAMRRWTATSGSSANAREVAERRLRSTDESYIVMGAVPSMTVHSGAYGFPGFRITDADRRPPRSVLRLANDGPPEGWPAADDLTAIQAWNAQVEIAREMAESRAMEKLRL